MRRRHHNGRPPRWALATAALLVTPTISGCEGLSPTNQGKREQVTGKAKGKAGAVAAKGAQRIVCDKPLHKYGTVSQGKKVEHIFVLRNAGGAPLTIKRAAGG